MGLPNGLDEVVSQQNGEDIKSGCQSGGMVVIHAVCHGDGGSLTAPLLTSPPPKNKPYLFQSSSPFSFCSCCRSDLTSNGCFLTVSTPGSQWMVFRKKAEMCGESETASGRWSHLWSCQISVDLCRLNLPWLRRKLYVQIAAKWLAVPNEEVAVRFAGLLRQSDEIHAGRLFPAGQPPPGVRTPGYSHVNGRVESTFSGCK